MAFKGGIYGWRTDDVARNPATNQYKGLTSFIADLRNARARDLEEKRVNKELANIRKKFREGNLDSYQKKKYVCKLLYIYILGWPLEFGHLEAVNLISANKYSEKQIGYLAVTLLFHEEHELLHLVVNSIRKDLLDHNELNNCLALHAIANVGGRTMGESLSPEVYRLLISPTSKSFVKKKASLTLLRLYRKHPGIIQSEWAERVISLMDDSDMGVALSVTSLVMALAQDHPDLYKGSYVKAANRLKKIIVDGDCAADYLYYDVPCPWIQVKFLRLLQYYPPSEDTHVRSLIRNSLEKILDMATGTHKGHVQQNNAQNAVLFEAINLVIHLDTEQALMVRISSRLGKFILARETNVRYLGLEAMTHLASRGETLDPLKRHEDSIIASLRDKDITVRRQALDLLYSMCDQSNAQSIVNELLKYLPAADYAIREDMVLKIAILTEKYATDIQWYVDISLRLLATAGDHVSDEVWQRVIQIVTNNEELQEYAARHILRYIKADHCHESLIKIGGYLLGEFGHIIAELPGCSPIEQFMALQSKLNGCPSGTRAIILSCFIKFVNILPEVKPQVLQVLRTYSNILDSELQQRACEYLAIATMSNDDILRTVCDEMPPFPERASPLLSRINEKTAVAGDRRTWHIGGKDANSLARQMSLPLAATNESTIDGSVGGVKRTMTAPITTNKTSTMATNGSGDLQGLDMSDPQLPSNPPNSSQLSPGWEHGYDRLVIRSQGVLFEDSQLQVGVKMEFKGDTGVIVLYFTNTTSFAMGSFTTAIDSSHSTGALKVDTKDLPDTELHPTAQTKQSLILQARKVFQESPTIRISYLAGSLQGLTLKLPILLHKYMMGAELSAEEFFKRWKQIGGAPREAQKIFGLVNKSRTTDGLTTRKIVEGCQWGILEGVDPNAKNFVGATVLQTSEGGKVGCLMRLEPNYDTLMFRLTIRATDESVAPILLKTMQDQLSKGAELSSG